MNFMSDPNTALHMNNTQVNIPGNSLNSLDMQSIAFHGQPSIPIIQCHQNNLDNLEEEVTNY